MEVEWRFRNDLQPKDLETITIEICKLKAKSFLINTWYRPPEVHYNCLIVMNNVYGKWTRRIKK